MKFMVWAGMRGWRKGGESTEEQMNMHEM